MAVDTIRCRANLEGCYDGNEVDFDISEDGTWDPETETIVCDRCYMRVVLASPSGRGLHREIPETIARLKAAGR